MTRLDVINAALMKVGLPLAADIGDADWNAASVFGPVADQVLRSFSWGFASRFAALRRAPDCPASGFRHAYHLPQDCLRVIDARQHETLRAPRARFVVAGRMLHCNVSPCNCRYVCRLHDTELWPEDFADAVACRMAAEIASLSAQYQGMVPGLVQMYQLSLAQAQAVDATETAENVPLDEAILAARSGGRPGK